MKIKFLLNSIILLIITISYACYYCHLHIETTKKYGLSLSLSKRLKNYNFKLDQPFSFLSVYEYCYVHASNIHTRVHVKTDLKDPYPPRRGNNSNPQD